MSPILTTAYWLSKAADAWSEAEAAQDHDARQTKLTIAQGYERLAKHAAHLAGMTGGYKQRE